MRQENKKNIFFNYLIQRKRIVLNIALVCFLFFLDQALKIFFEKNPVSTSSFLGFSLQEPIQNQGFIFGFKIIGNHLFVHFGLAALFLLFLFYYCVFIVFSDNRKFYFLQIALSLLFGGWLSNLWDKMLQFYVLDYIRWDLFESFTIYLNLADIFQTFGWLILFQQILSLRKQLWRKNQKRNKLVVLKTFQYQFLAYCSLIFVLLSVFCLLLIQQILIVVGLSEVDLIKEISYSFLLGYFFIVVLLYFFIGLFFVYLSNKIYGPVYAFERYIRNLLEGQPTPEQFRLRDKDQFKNLEALAKDIKEKIESVKKHTKHKK